MSLQSIVDAAAKLDIDDASPDDTPPAESNLSYEEKVIPLEYNEEKKTKTKSKGRPNIHPIEGRTYLLQSEVIDALANPEAFAQKLQQMYSISDSRIEEFNTYKVDYGAAKWTDFTLYGSVSSVMNIASSILTMFPGCESKIRLSKSRIVPASHALYKQPEVETVTIKGKEQKRLISQEFSPVNIYVYISVALEP